MDIMSKIEKILRLTNSPEYYEATEAAKKSLALMEKYDIKLDQFDGYNKHLIDSLKVKNKKIKNKATAKAKAIKMEQLENWEIDEVTIKKYYTGDTYSKFFVRKLNHKLLMFKEEFEEKTRLLNEVWLWEWFHKSINDCFHRYLIHYDNGKWVGLSPFRSSRNSMDTDRAIFNVNYFDDSDDLISKSPQTFLKLKIKKLGNQTFKIEIFADYTSILHHQYIARIYFPNLQTSHTFQLLKEKLPITTLQFLLENILSIAANYELNWGKGLKQKDLSREARDKEFNIADNILF